MWDETRIRPRRKIADIGLMLEGLTKVIFLWLHGAHMGTKGDGWMFNIFHHIIWPCKRHDSA